LPGFVITRRKIRPGYGGEEKENNRRRRVFLPGSTGVETSKNLIPPAGGFTAQFPGQTASPDPDRRRGESITG
jgi:hypothetical protein